MADISSLQSNNADLLDQQQQITQEQKQFTMAMNLEKAKQEAIQQAAQMPE
jgi:hypothetical protein